MNKLISNWKNTMQKQKSAKKAQKVENNENEVPQDIQQFNKNEKKDSQFQSAKKIQNLSQQTQKKLISDFSSSSSDEELFETNFKNRNKRFQESNKKQSQPLEEITNTTNLQASQSLNLDETIQELNETKISKEKDIDQEMKEAFQIKSEMRQQLPSCKPPNANKRKVNSQYSVQMDECIFKILDIFNYKANLPLADKKNQIKIIMEQFMSSQQQSCNLEEQSQQINQSCSWKQQLNSSKMESSKIMSEIESKLFESEREKMLFKQAKDNLQEKCEMLYRELQSKELNLELVSILKQNTVTLEQTNHELMNEISRNKQREKAQQELFSQQINEFATMYEKLKSHCQENQKVYEEKQIIN